MSQAAVDAIRAEIQALHDAGTYKQMPVLDGPMGPIVTLADGREIVNLCSNNYLGLANHPDVIAAAQDALARHGNGTPSARPSWARATR